MLKIHEYTDFIGQSVAHLTIKSSLLMFRQMIELLIVVGILKMSTCGKGCHLATYKV